MMNNLQGKFIFLSELIKIPVFDAQTNKKIGQVIDILAAFKEMYPRASGLIMRHKEERKRFYIPWKNVRKILERKAIYIEVTPDIFATENKIPEEEILLKDILLDKQIVDVNGSKVVRVNDLHLLKEDSKLWIVHVDVGITGLLRRLGCLRFFNFVLKLVSSVELEDRFIPWKFVQPITPAIGYDALSLKVHHSRLTELHPAELAEIIIDLGSEERIDILKSLDNVTAARTFQALPLKIRLQIATQIPHEQLVNIIKEMAIDEAVDLLRELPQRKINAVFNHLAPEKVTQISRLLGLSKRIAGSIMNTEFISVKHDLAAAAVLDKIKNESRKKESIYYIYVLDENDLLVGMVTLRELLSVPSEKIISEFMHRRVVKVKVETNIKDVINIFSKYDFIMIPVVDKQNKIQGIITMKDAFESVLRHIRTEESK